MLQDIVRLERSTPLTTVADQTTTAIQSTGFVAVALAKGTGPEQRAESVSTQRLQYTVSYTNDKSVVFLAGAARSQTPMSAIYLHIFTAV